MVDGSAVDHPTQRRCGDQRTIVTDPDGVVTIESLQPGQTLVPHHEHGRGEGVGPGEGRTEHRQRGKPIGRRPVATVPEMGSSFRGSRCGDGAGLDLDGRPLEPVKCTASGLRHDGGKRSECDADQCLGYERHYQTISCPAQHIVNKCCEHTLECADLGIGYR